MRSPFRAEGLYPTLPPLTKGRNNQRQLTGSGGITA